MITIVNIDTGCKVLRVTSTSMSKLLDWTKYFTSSHFQLTLFVILRRIMLYQVGLIESGAHSRNLITLYV